MPELTDAQMNAILDSLFADRKLEAIKLYREATGLNLLESKNFIEKLQASLKEKQPHHFQAESKTGCLGVVLGLLILVWLLR
jgi:ribosomal protein L7/L12